MLVITRLWSAFLNFGFFLDKQNKMLYPKCIIDLWELEQMV